MDICFKNIILQTKDISDGVYKYDKFNSSKDSHQENISFILVTFEVLKLDKFKLIKFLHRQKI